jgi:hypothetical protein
MNRLDDTRVLRLPTKPVFVDWRGARRRLVIVGGVAVAVSMLVWLSLMVISFSVVLGAGAPAPGSG